MASQEFLEKRNEYLEGMNKFLGEMIDYYENSISSFLDLKSTYINLNEKSKEHIDYLKKHDAIKQTKVEKFHADSIESEKRYEDVCGLLLPVVVDMINSDGEYIVNFIDGYNITIGNPKDESGQSDYDIHVGSGILHLLNRNNKIEVAIYDIDSIADIENYPHILKYSLSELLIISDIGEVIEKYLKHKKEGNDDEIAR